MQNIKTIEQHQQQNNTKLKNNNTHIHNKLKTTTGHSIETAYKNTNAKTQQLNSQSKIAQQNNTKNTQTQAQPPHDKTNNN